MLKPMPSVTKQGLPQRMTTIPMKVPKRKLTNLPPRGANVSQVVAQRPQMLVLVPSPNIRKARAKRRSPNPKRW